MSTLRREAHAMPNDVRNALHASNLWAAYEARPPYQRNDYLGWIGSAKREPTRQKRINQMLDELTRGDVYMKMAWRPSSIADGRG